MTRRLRGWLCGSCLLPVLAFAQPQPQSELPLQRGQVVAEVRTLAEPGQQYALFLPEKYDARRRWPVLVLLDARGRGEHVARLAEAAARANGWIVLGSYQSRSDTDENATLRALQAMLREAGQRYAYDPRRIYLGGFSGTAKTLWTQVGPLRNVIAGVFGNGGARPPELGALRQAPPAFFGTAGSADFNYQEMYALDEALGEAGAVHRLEIFDGPHAWPPAEVFAQALDWFDLVAMAQGRMPKDEGWIDRQMAARQADARGVPSALERWRRLEQVVRDFDGLRDVGALRQEARAMQRHPAWRAERKLEQRLRGEERAAAQRLEAWIARMGQRDATTGRLPSLDKASALRELRVAMLRKMADAGDAAVAASARRRLERIGVATGFYLPLRHAATGDLAHAAALFEIATAIFADRPATWWRLAELRARMGRKDDAFAALAQARRLGFVDVESLAGEAAWNALRDDPRWPAAASPLP